MKKYLFGGVIIVGLFVVFTTYSKNQTSPAAVALAGSSQSVSSPTFCHTFNSYIGVGTKGTEVSYLKYALILQGLLPKSDTSNVFDSATKQAVLKFQTAHGVPTADGAVGAKTDAALSKIYGCIAVVPPQSGNSMILAGLDSNNPASQTFYVNPATGVKGATLLVFDAQSVSGNSQINEVDATISSSGTAPIAVYLYDGTTMLSSKSLSIGSSHSVAFTNLTDQIISGAAHAFSIKVDLPPSTVSGSISSASLTKISFRQPNGAASSVVSSLTGNSQTFNIASSNLTFLSASATSLGTNPSGQTIGIAGNFNLQVLPQPGQMVQPKASDFVVYVGTSLASAIQATSTSVYNIQPLPTNNVLSGESTYTFSLSAVVNPGVLPSAGVYKFYLISASTTVFSSSNTPVQQTLTGSSLANFYTSGVTVIK